MNANQIFRLGTGCGIEIRGAGLRVVAVRSRRAGVQVLGHCEIGDFRERPAAEWGAEYRAFLEDLHLSHLSATVLLPRDEVIVREIRMPVLAKKELAAAVGYQLENLHPFDPGEIYHAFAPLRALREQNVSLPLAVVIAEKTKVDAYADLFENAGIAVESFTVAAAAFFGGVRVRWDAPPVPFVIADFGSEGLEIYGEGAGRALLSTRFDLKRMPAPRALSLAGADLRLETDQTAKLVRVGEAREESDSTATPAESFDPGLPGRGTPGPGPGHGRQAARPALCHTGTMNPPSHAASDPKLEFPNIYLSEYLSIRSAGLSGRPVLRRSRARNLRKRTSRCPNPKIDRCGPI